jgi:hypothetical protein
VKLIEIFLPTSDGSGHPFPHTHFDSVRTELTNRFGGVTAFLRAPGSGLWRDPNGEVHRDEVAVFEVMAESIENDWWRAFRQRMEMQFAQDVVLIRTSSVEQI